MKVIVCVDEYGGMLFGGKRQSRDPAVSEDILNDIADRSLFISPFSKKIFCAAKNIKIRKNPLLRAKDNDFCFIEDIALLPYVKKIDTIIIYNWNRHYPSDKFFDIPLSENGFNLSERSELIGVSHEKITKEIYKK